MKNFIYKIFLFSYLTISVSACSKKSSNEDIERCIYPSITMDNEQNDPVLLSKIFPKYRLIELETNDDCLIGGFGSKIIKYDSLFYIQSVNEVLVFDKDGIYLKKLSACGAGPEEYTQIRDYDIVSDYNEIWICSDSRSISKYDLETFDFKEKLSFDFGLFTIKYIGEDRFITSSGDDDGIFKIIDKNGDIIESFYENDKANTGSVMVDFYYSPSCNKIVHNLQNSNEIIYYDLNSKKLGISRLLNCGDNLLTAADNVKAMEKGDLMEQMRFVSENYIQIRQVAEFDNNIIMLLRYPGNKWKTLISKDRKSVLIPHFPADQSMVQNDIVENAHPMMLNTIVCGDSRDSFLFLAEIEDSENNPYILEVTKVAIP